MEHPAAYLLSKDPKGFMKGRAIAGNIINALTLVDYCNTTGLDGIILLVDFHSAFDSCNWEAIRETFCTYGYAQKFVDMVMLCYNDVKTAVMNNNSWTEWIKLKSGVKQGCPLSGLIFVHLTSIIEQKIKQNHHIEWIKIPGCPTKLIDMFADDLWNYIKFSEQSFQELMFKYAEFEDFAGLAINYDKTEIMRMGSICNLNARFYSHRPLQWSDGPVKILGVNIFSETQLTMKHNCSDALRKACNTFKM